MLTESPSDLNIVILGLVLFVTFLFATENFGWISKIDKMEEKSLSNDQVEKIQVLEKVSREMERRRQRKIKELYSKIANLESQRNSLLERLLQEKEEDNLEKLKILVQKNYEEEQRVLTERALHDKEADLETMEKLYLDARRQVVLLDVKDAQLKNKVASFRILIIRNLKFKRKYVN